MFFTSEDLKKMFTSVYTDFNLIDYESLKINDFRRENYDGFNFIKDGDIFLNIVEPFKKEQPQTYQYLAEGTFFYAVKKSSIPVMDDITQFGVIINDLVSYISYKTSYVDQERFSEVPDFLWNSWFYKTSGWVLAEETIANIDKANLPSTLLLPLSSIVDGIEDKTGTVLSKYTCFLESKFNTPFKQNYNGEFTDDKYFELRCLLDTRLNDDWSKSGYQIFTSSHNQEKNLYLVPRADVMGIKKLSHPAEAIDAYAAHVFGRKEGEFDFMQYAESF